MKTAHYMNIASAVAQLSKDRSTKVGALALATDGSPLTWGYNGFPRGCDDDVEERHQRPAKYEWTEHAERNLIYNAARHGISLLGGTIVVTKLPCMDCARAIVQAGFTTIIAPPVDDDSRWAASNAQAVQLFKETGVLIRYV